MPLKAEVEDADGTIYIGDGCMGRDPRMPTDEWYLEQAAGLIHFWLGASRAERTDFVAINAKGDMLDDFTSN